MSENISFELPVEQRRRFAWWFFCNAPLLREAQRVMVADIEGRRRIVRLLRRYGGGRLAP